MKPIKLVIEMKDGGIIYTVANDDVDIVIIHRDTGKVSEVVRPDDVCSISNFYNEHEESPDIYSKLVERGFVRDKKRVKKNVLKTKFPHLDARGNGDIMNAYATRDKQKKVTMCLDFTNDGKGGYYRVHLEITGAEPYSGTDFPATPQGLENALALFQKHVDKYREEYGLVININRYDQEKARIELLSK